MAKRHRTDVSPPLLTDTNPTISENIPDDFSDTSAGTSKKFNRIDPKLIAKPTTPVITCNFLPNCNERPFGSYAEYESHYSQEHMNRCIECHKNFPSDRYLTIHIAENHDAFAALKRERGEKTYACFVEGCDRMCSTPQKRRLHVIDKHGFPKDFYFRLVDNGIDNCNSLLRRPRRPSKTTANSNNNNNQQSSRQQKLDQKEMSTSTSELDSVMSVDSVDTEKGSDKPQQIKNINSSNNDLDQMTEMMASVKLIPRSVKFGRRGGGMVGFSSRR